MRLDIVDAGDAGRVYHGVEMIFGEEWSTARLSRISSTSCLDLDSGWRSRADAR